MNRYDVDIEKLITQLLPISLRKASILNLMFVLVFPIKSVYKLFIDLLNAKKTELKYTGQVVLLEKLLRDHYNNDLIYITDGNLYKDTYITYSALQEEISYQQYINYHNDGKDDLYIGNYLADDLAHFIIHMPSSFIVDNKLYPHGEKGLRKIVNKYKLAGKKFKVVYDIK